MTPGLDPELVKGLGAALIVGALVGIERERSKALSGNVGIGGVRTRGQQQRDRYNNGR